MLGAGATVELRDAAARRARRAAARAHAAASPADDPRAALFASDDSPLNPKFTFEQFVIGDANRFAHAAALAVAELPGPAPTTRSSSSARPASARPTSCTPSATTSAPTAAASPSATRRSSASPTSSWRPCKARDVDAFKHRYRRNDVLLIDDVQFLESKVKTEEEFFHTFNALHETGSQLVLTSDRPPRDIAALEDRLRQRFGAGLVVDIRSPDPATRLTVLRKRAHHDGIDVADDGVLELIAERVTDNIRALEAALDPRRRLRVADRPADRPRAGRRGPRPSSTGAPPPRRRGGPPTVERIQDARRRGLRPHPRGAAVALARGARRLAAAGRHVPRPRAHARDACRPSGAHFGGRDHSTVLHACKRAADRIGTDPDAYDAVASITARLTERRGLTGGVDRLRRLLCAKTPQRPVVSAAVHTSTAPMTPDSLLLRSSS